MRWVVDVNVAIVANGKASHIGLDCQIRAIEALKKIKEKGIAILDEAGEILGLYREHLSASGQPGAGDWFMQHVSTVYDARYVERIPIQKIADGEYKDFPADAELKGFDLDDRIYIALVMASKKPVRLVNAADSDYKHYKQALEKNAVKVEELCPQSLK